MALEAVQAQAGHASIESTRIYLHLADDWLAAQYRKAAEAIDAQILTPRGPSEHGPVRGERADAAARTGTTSSGGPAGHRDDAALPGPDRVRAAAGQRHRHRHRVALLRGLPRREHRDLRRSGEVAPPPRRGLQAVARRPARAEQGTPVTNATLAHRLGTLRMFFVRIDEWGWPEAPPRVPMFPGDLPRRTTHCPKPLTTPRDREAAPRRARPTADSWSGSPSKSCCVPGCASANTPPCPPTPSCTIGAAPWLHVPVGKLGDDRYLPLHPQVHDLIEHLPRRHTSPPDHPLLLPRENGRAARPALRHPDDQPGRRRRRARPHLHPHQLRHTLATQAINRGMSLEAIAAMLGHRSMDMTLRYAKIAEPHRGR